MAESPQSSSPLQGYNTAGEEPNHAGGQKEPTPARSKRLRSSRARTASNPARDGRGRFTSRRGASVDLDPRGDPDSDADSDDSLAWDAQQESLDGTTGTRRWSTGTQFSVPVATDGEEEDLSTVEEGRESRASGPSVQQQPPAANAMADVVHHRAEVARALMEIEDDITPFIGRQVSPTCLARLIETATALKRTLQAGHMYLTTNDAAAYAGAMEASVTGSRRAISGFIVDLEEARAIADNAATALAAAEAAAAAPQLNPAKQELIRGRVGRVVVDLSDLDGECKLFCEMKLKGDEQLYECAEMHKVLAGRLDLAAEECKALVTITLDNNLFKESETMDDVGGRLRNMKQVVDQSMLTKRKNAGVWTEKGRRAARRGDLKMPSFSGAATDRFTVYEFEKEWVSYKAALNYSVEEALKELKVSVLPPARSAVDKLASEEDIFKYLRTHYGNPVLLLSAREAEIRGWADCKGNDQTRREWLIHAKNRLEATVTLCSDHDILKYLHFSSLAGIVQSKLPWDMVKDFKKILVKHLSPSGVLEKEIVIDLLLKFIDEKIMDCTLGVNLDIVNFLGSDVDVKPAAGTGTSSQNSDSAGTSGKPAWSKNGRGGHKQHSQYGGGRGGQDGNSGRGGGQSNHDGGGARGGGQDGGQSNINPAKCVSCGLEHPFLFYCEDYIKAGVGDRFHMVRAQKTCVRCLNMSRRFTGKKTDWWDLHEKYCKTAFQCKIGHCASKSKEKQLHMTICFTHVTENRQTEGDFIKSMDSKALPSGFSLGNLRFLHMLGQFTHQPANLATMSQQTVWDVEGYELIPDVADPAIFMMQMLPSDTDPTKELLCFYDSGCGAAGISERACELLHSCTVRQGPTVLEVAGGKSIMVPYGDEQFHLALAGTKQKATFTGLKMPHITSTFPVFVLTEAWNDLQSGAAANRVKIPEVDEVIGGSCVDVIIGARYFKHYPELVYSLPSGLAVYRAKLKSASGRQAVLGGPHAAWTLAEEACRHMNPRVYLTHEARAWYQQQSWIAINQGKLSRMQHLEEDEEAEYKSITIMEKDQLTSGCSHCHCGEHSAVGEPQGGIYSAAVEEKNLWRVEDLGTESPYRCISCRNCSKCRNGEDLEAISFKEEAEQALIEDSVELDVGNNMLWAALPFIEDPVANLRPNRFVAEKVLQSQLRLFEKNPGMREDTVKSHQKLMDRGHVMAEADLPASYKAAMDSTPGDGYFIPWRTVYNEGSLSTPCRLVFDASSKTPGGNSLNGILAKGQNRLSKLQHLLIRFRKGPAAVTADISMAYNGTRLKPQDLKYQRYLWKADLLPDSPTIVMVVATLIYGVKPSGQQCQVSIEKLACHYQDQGQCLEGARALKEDTYVDDIITSVEKSEQCQQVASDIEKILSTGSMAVKAFSFSGQKPDEKVSADGVHVGLAGYLWDTKEDHIKLDIGPPRLGRGKRGRSAPPVTGDFKSALSQNFTKRILTGLVAGVFDPLGLVTPIIAGFKLDLHELCMLKLDWDDPVPTTLLDKWVGNMEKIQLLGNCVFQRAVVPEDAVDLKIELMVATDASQNIGVVAVYGRLKRTNGLYSCQLLAGRSKILAGLTIPKAELKSAVAGAVTASVVRRNLGDLYAGSMFVTDSTICLFWISQDDRPLQVGVRNAVAEIWRFSEPGEWYHVVSELNIADLGTREAQVHEVGLDSDWQNGHRWMQLPRDQLPVKTAAEVILSAEEARLAASELRAKDVRGHEIHLQTSAIGERYALSRYLVDPCKFTWSKSVRVMAIVWIFVDCCWKAAKERRAVPIEDPGSELPSRQAQRRSAVARLTSLSREEVDRAEMYYYKKGTGEVLRLSKPKDYRGCSEMRGEVLFFSGRLLDSGAVNALEEVMFDLNPVTFCRPLLDRYSPVAYSIMLETHWSKVHHLNATTTYRESLEVAYTIRGRDLAHEIREGCHFCKRFKARMVEVEMGKVHGSRLAIAPPFTYAQVDLLGPYEARCEHNHRSVVKVWGAVFKDPASGAIFVHAMPKYDTSAFIQAYTRFAARFCHPMKLYPDEGSQLLKACQTMEIDWLDVSKTLNSKHGVGVEFEPCPVGGHNYNGQVERSIREVKKLFDTVYKGIKLDLMGFETAFAWISNELNNLPLCLGTKYRDLDSLDLLTPNRLIHGRANRRAMSGPCTVDKPSRMLEKMYDVFEAWWKAWYNEKLADYVAKPPKWLKSDPNLTEGDVVIFQKKGGEQVLGSPIWTVGRVVKADLSTMDGKVRDVTIEYKNPTEKTTRTTHRAARTVAVLHKEGDLDLMQELNQAARMAESEYRSRELYVDQQLAVVREVERCRECAAPVMCLRHAQYFCARPYSYSADDPALEEWAEYNQAESLLDENCSFTGEHDALCKVLSIHVDPWLGW